MGPQEHGVRIHEPPVRARPDRVMIRPFRRFTMRRLVLALLACAVPAASFAVTSHEAFEKLKSLDGTWNVSVQGQDATVGWKTTAGGSAVIETLFQGTPHEMVSVYYLDGDTLRITHYCAAGNQPHMRFDEKRSTPQEYVFAFDGGTSFNPKKDMHIHEGRIAFGPEGVHEQWMGWTAGKQSDIHEFTLHPQM
jgi:hypothetical protein